MTHRHLTVGINSYPLAPLSGCVNDALDWNVLLTELGSSGRVLLDDAATKQAILDSLAEMLRASNWRDRAVFQFSGHGTWQPDMDGDEPDSRDEALVPHDYTESGLILDDELHQVITANRPFGVQVLIISDSCHSGTVSRAVGLESRAGSPRYLPPVHVLDEQTLTVARQVQGKPARGFPRQSAALLSACKDTEVAWDSSFDDRPNGAFTRAAIDVYRENRPTSLTGWVKGIQSRISGQTPQIAGSWRQRTLWKPL